MRVSWSTGRLPLLVVVEVLILKQLLCDAQNEVEAWSSSSDRAISRRSWFLEHGGRRAAASAAAMAYGLVSPPQAVLASDDVDDAK
jgi:hypothetical protein